MSANPYAMPEAELLVVPSSNVRGCYRIGKDILFVPNTGELPHRCIKCNAPAQQPSKRRTFYWHASGWYLLILFNLIVYAVAAAFVRKKVLLSPGLCAEHASKRRMRIWSAFGVLGLGVVGCYLSAAFDSPVGFFVSIFGSLLLSIIVAMTARIMYPVGIDDRGARFKGCGAEFLQSLESNRPY